MTYTNTNNSTLSEERQTALKRFNNLITLRMEQLKYHLGATVETERTLQKKETEYGTLIKIDEDPILDGPYFNGGPLPCIPKMEYMLHMDNGKLKYVNNKENEIIGKYNEGDKVQLYIETYTKTTKDYVNNNFDKKEVIGEPTLETILILMHK